MADDMTNGASAIEVAALSQRVSGVEAAVESIRKAIESLDSKFDDKSKTPWGTILAGATLLFTVMTSFVTIVGGVVAWGLLTNISSISEDQKQFRAELIVELREMRQSYVTSREYQERNIARDNEVATLRDGRIRADQELQRQIDQNRNDFQAFATSMGNGRDFIQDLKEEQSRMRAEISELRTRLAANGLSTN